MPFATLGNYYAVTSTSHRDSKVEVEADVDVLRVRPSCVQLAVLLITAVASTSDFH